MEIFPAYEEDRAVRVEFFGDRIDGIAEIDPLRGVFKKRLERTALFPASHYVTEKNRALRAMEAIKAELKGVSTRSTKKGSLSRPSVSRSGPTTIWR